MSRGEKSFTMVTKKRVTPAKTVSPDAERDRSAPEVRVLRRFRLVFNAVKTHFQQVEKKAGVGDSQPYVGIDNRGAGAEVAQWMADQGCNDVALIHGNLASSATAERVAGFRAALVAQGIRLPAGLVQSAAGLEHLQIGHQGMGRLLKRKKAPQAVFCTSDLIAYGAHRCAREAGLQVGRDLVLVGFDDSPMNAWIAPWLHAVRVPYAAYGAAIVRALGEGGARPTILRHELVIWA